MAEYLDQQQTNYSDDSLQYTFFGQYAGQTFKAGISGALTKVKLYFGKYGTPANLLVQIQGVTWNGTYWIPDNTPLSSEEIAEGSISSTPSEVTATFTTPTNVVAGNRYAVIIRQKADGGDGNNYYEVLKGDRYGGDVYTDGKYVRTADGGTNWYKLADFDAYFKTYVTINEEIEDINNDFRIAGSIIDINNDFRAFQTKVEMDIDNDFRSVIEVIKDISNNFNSVKEALFDALNNVVFLYRTIKDTFNVFVMIKDSVEDINNDIRTKKITSYDIINDFRMLSSWQVPQAGEVGFQSQGKTEVKVYISSVEQTDVDVDSISYTESLNAPWSASFNLGRPYDDTKPDVGSGVEIKYKGILLYKGYITEINPTDTPESIKITCQNEYWNLNKTKKYFLVGRKPLDVEEYYYETIGSALNGLGFSYGIGNFIPQTIDLYGSGTSDAISRLVQDSGNFGWFIDVNGTKRIWQGGAGSIVNLERQELGKNLGLYQVITHNIRESIIGIINKFRVQMGTKTTRNTSEVYRDGTGEKDNTYTYIKNITVYGQPAWDRNLEVLAKDSETGYGYDYQDPNKDYSDVFRKYWLPNLTYNESKYNDRRPPLVEITEGTPFINYNRKYLKDGFTIDYENKQEWGVLGTEIYGFRPYITFSEPQVNINLDQYKQWESIKSKNVKVHLYKEYTVTYRNIESPDQANDEEEPTETKLMFYTDKMGSYPETIIGTLNLSNLSVQEGWTIYDYEEVLVSKWVYDFWGKLVLTEIPEIRKVIVEKMNSWDDTEFAEDIAYWQLSKIQDMKISGNINLTIDAMLYYGIDLSKRIQISNVVDPVNITSITYNFSSFIATLNIEKTNYYKRSVSVAYRGE